MSSPVQVTLIANTGLLLRYENTAILLDALFSQGEHGFSAPSAGTWEKMLSGEAPFERVDYVLDPGIEPSLLHHRRILLPSEPPGKPVD